jgi:hypothetical protein
VVRERAVRFAVELDDVAAETAQELGCVDAGDTVAGVGDDPEPPGERDEAAPRCTIFTPLYSIGL